MSFIQKRLHMIGMLVLMLGIREVCDFLNVPHETAVYFVLAALIGYIGAAITDLKKGK